MTQRVLITGTSSGIGLDTAVLLADQGWQVVATLRNLEKRSALDEAAAARGVSLEVRQLDVADLTSIEACIEGVERDLGPIDALVNNAGFGRLGSVEQLDDAALRQVMDTNFFGVWNTTRAVLPRMRERGSGRIVTVSSIGGLVAQPFNDAYCAAKFAVEGMMESLAPVARELGLHVSVIEPGPVNTEFVNSTRSLSADLLREGAPGYEALIGHYAASTTEVFAQHGQTGEEIAAIIVEALTSDAPQFRYVTSPFAEGFAKQKYVDTTGNTIIEIFQSRLRA